MKNSITTKAITLGNFLSTIMNRSEAFKLAWETVKSTAAEVITFVKKSTNKITTRVVSKDLTKFVELAGGTSNRKPGQIIAIDLFKHLTGEARPIISFYQENIVNI